MALQSLMCRQGLALVMMCALAACARPVPGPNAEAGPQKPADTPLASKPTLGQEVSAVADNKVQVAFPEGGTALTPDAQHNLDLAARLYRDAKPVAMFVAGHADGKGDEYGNLLLSARRAEAVKQGLVARGIPPDRLLLQAYGASEPADAGDVRAPGNRRVVITWRLL